MSRTERRLQRPAVSSRQYPLQVQPSRPQFLPERYPVAVEEVPHLIDDIVVNPVAKESLEPDFRYLASKDYLLDSACLSVPLRKGDKGILTPDYWGRAIVLETGSIFYGGAGSGIIGGTVSGKGCFRSGKYYQKNHTIESSSYMPIGFFGARDAAKEIEVGNGLLEVGFRCSLSLGYVVLKREETKAFLLDRWRDNDAVVEDIERCFAMLEKWQEQPAFLGRVVGVTSRLVGVKPENLYRRAEFVRAAGLFCDEAIVNPDHFSSYLTPGSYAKTLEVLSKIANRRRLNLVEFAYLVSLYIGIFESNCRALEQARVHPALAKYQNLGFILRAGKDNDPMCNTVDFEEAVTDSSRRPNDFVGDYLPAKRHLAAWLRDEVAPNFFADYGTEKEELIKMINALFDIKASKGFY